MLERRAGRAYRGGVGETRCETSWPKRQPQIAVAAENRRGELVIRPLAAPAPRRTIALVWRPASPLGSLLREVATLLRAAALAPEKPKKMRRSTI